MKNIKHQLPYFICQSNFVFYKLMNEDENILEEYRTAFRKYAKDGIIDMDKRLKHKFSFQIHHLEDFIERVEGIIPPNRQSQFFVTLILNGTGEKTIGYFTFPLQKNTLFIIPQRVTHSSKYWSSTCSGYFIAFNIEFFLQNVFPKHLINNKKIFKTSIKPFLVLSDAEAKKLKTIYEYILKEYNDQLKLKNEMIAIKILELLIQCDRLFMDAETHQKESVYNDTVEQFNELIQKNFTKERSVKFYADALHTHPNHLNAIVKKFTGLTAKDTITNHILLEARYLLHSTSLSIKEVSDKLGFDDPNYFSSFFRKHLSLSPAKYKQEPV